MKNLESFDRPFYCQSDANAFVVLFLVRQRVRLCQSDGMALTLQTSLVNRKSKMKKKAFQKNEKRLLLATNLRSVDVLNHMPRDMYYDPSPVESYCLLEGHDGHTLAFDSFPSAIGL